MSKQDPSPPENLVGKDLNFALAVGAEQGRQSVTARKAGTISDLLLPISPSAVPVKKALSNLAKAINLALQEDFLETELDTAYRAARVRQGRVQMLHQDYIGLGDGLFAKVGRVTRSLQLTMKGPDPASPEGKQWLAEHGPSPIRGFLDLVGRKLNLLQEFEDKVPMYVEQMLDRLEAVRMITGWDRSEWEITTSSVGLDVFLTPVTPNVAEPA